MTCHPRDRAKRFEQRAVVACVVVYLSPVAAYLVYSRDSVQAIPPVQVHEAMRQPLAPRS